MTGQEILSELQVCALKLYQERGYTAGVETCFMGLVEEVGELAEIITLSQNDYQPTTKKASKQMDSVGHEVGDIILYALSICNHVGEQAEWHDDLRAK